MNTVPCEPCGCPETQTVNVPGVEGADGADGVDGIDSFTTTTADFTIPAIGGTVVVPVAASAWMVLGQIIVFAGPAHFQVVSLPGATSVEVEFLGYALDLAPGVVIASGAKVGPAGSQPFLALTASAALNFGNTLAQTSTDLTIAVAGAADGDPVSLGVPNAAVNADACYTAFVSAANTVTVRFNNYSAGAINPASATFKVVVFKT